MSSEGYSSKAGCENGIESVRNNAPDDNRYEKKQAANGSPYFVLKAANGQVIGSSEMYESNAACENGIASLRKNAPTLRFRTNHKKKENFRYNVFGIGFPEAFAFQQNNN